MIANRPAGTGATPEEFARLQAGMVPNWVERLKARGVDLETHYASRHRAYLRRWREALNHVAPGCAILDIGGGYTNDLLLSALRDGKYDYYAVDIDPLVVATNPGKAAAYGIPADHYIRSENTELPFPAGRFDLVFSSHCVEHSADIVRTLAEVRRVLKPSGVFFFAVPIGWDPAVEHLYFLDQQDWIRLAEACGFAVHGTLNGDFYPEEGYDLAVICSPNGATAPFDLDRFRKASYQVHPVDHPSLTYVGSWERRPDCMAGMGPGASVTFAGAASEVVFLCGSNDWAGVVEARGEAVAHVDLYQWFRTSRPVFVKTGPPASLASAELTPERILATLKSPRQSARRALHLVRALKDPGQRTASLRLASRNPVAKDAQLFVQGVLTR